MQPKFVIITGTGRGIGLEVAKLFAAAGHRILALSRNHKALQALSYPNVQCFLFDLAEESSFDRLSALLAREGRQVDILINNAGILLNKSFAATSYREFEMVYRVNTLGVAETIRRTLPFMAPNGHVVTISSMGGVQGSVKFPGLSAYSSSKGALITLTEVLAEEYKSTGPSFNALALGAVQTEMLSEAFPGYKAPLTAGEMAQYIFTFSLEGNHYYNGKTLQVSVSTP